MPGVARGEAVGALNPLLCFAYQTRNVLTDLVGLKFRVRDVTTAPVTERVALTVVDLVAARLGVGRYAATFTPAAEWNLGTHEIEWQWQTTAGGPWRTVRQRFEVLDPDSFVTGALYVGYLDSKEIVATAGSIAAAQRAIDETSRYVETLTARFFEPRYCTFDLNGHGTRGVALPHPIIGLEKVELGYAGSIGPDARTIIGTDDLTIYGRHLTGLLDPDDRDAPRIDYVPSTLSTLIGIATEFPRGKQNVHVYGIFGYTDFDTTPGGQLPRKLTRAVQILATKLILDPTAADPLSAGGKVKSARTRDQAITFATAAEGGVGAVTGDRAVDDLLVLFMRPPQLGSA